MSAKAQHEYEKGTRLLVEGNAQGSIEHFLRVVEEKPRYYGPYHNLAMAYFHVGQFDAAAQNFQKSIDLSGASYAPSLYGLAMVLYRKEQSAQAEPLALRALALQPSAAGKIGLGMVQLALGHLSDAERSAHDAIQLNPGLADAYFLLATIHERKHNPSAVVGDIRTYLKLAPHDSLAPVAQALLDRAQQAVRALRME
jgi:Tfp pilus assembly protein PilF